MVVTFSTTSFCWRHSSTLPSRAMARGSNRGRSPLPAGCANWFWSQLPSRSASRTPRVALRTQPRRVLRAAEYLKGAKDEDRPFLEAVRPAHIWVVCLDLSDNPALHEQKETHAVFVRITDGRPRCVGIGRPPQAP